jgi:ketosteroid isomerase-like protein
MLKRLFLSLAFLSSAFISFSQDKDDLAIRKVLAQQAAMWNAGDMEGYMQGYWNNDSLLFVGKNGPTYGYNNTLERYKKSYADTAQMGKLHFTIGEVKKLSPEYRFVLGRWELKRTAGALGGYFTLLFRKLKGEWVIIADHSS